MKKKSQAQSQMFIYILSILIIGMLLYFGIKWIGEIMHSADETDIIKFKIEIENAFETMLSNYGSARNYEFNIPGNTNKICFVDSYADQSLIKLSNLCDSSDIENYSPLICNAWKSNVSSVLFDPPFKTEIEIGNIQIPHISKYICFSILKNKNINIRLESLGESIRVLRNEK